MLNFAAIDFETANHYRTSICSMGIVIVRNGVITEKIYRLIKPRPDFYCKWTTRIHGLSNVHTRLEQEFPPVWKSVRNRIEDLPLVAHNSMFDETCLRMTHQVFGMKYPEYKFMCTYLAALRSYPQLENHRLVTVASHVGFELTNNHNALADAEACAAIAMKVFPDYVDDTAPYNDYDAVLEFRKKMGK